MSYANTPFPGSLAARQMKLAEMAQAKQKREEASAPPPPGKQAVVEEWFDDDGEYSDDEGFGSNDLPMHEQQGIRRQQQQQQRQQFVPPQPVLRRQTASARKRVSVPVTPAQIDSIQRGRASHRAAQESTAAPRQPARAQRAGRSHAPAHAPVQHVASQPTSTRRVILEMPTENGVLGFSPVVVKVYRKMCLHDSVKTNNEAPLDLGSIFCAEELGASYGRCIHEWSVMADAVIVYTDIGLSPQMSLSIAKYNSSGTPVEYRTLGPSWHSAYTKLMTATDYGPTRPPTPLPVAEQPFPYTPMPMMLASPHAALMQEPLIATPEASDSEGSTDGKASDSEEEEEETEIVIAPEPKKRRTRRSMRTAAAEEKVDTALVSALADFSMP